MTNLGIIKSIILGKLNEAYFSKKISKEADDLTADFIETVKSSPVLQLEMRVFDNIENKYIDNDVLATRYIDSCLKLFESVNIKDFKNANKKLSSILKPDILKEGVEKDKINAKLYNAVFNLVEQTLLKEDADIDLLHESFTTVLEHVKSDNKVGLINENIKKSDVMDEFVIRMAIDKYNEKYSKILTEDDQKLIKSLNKTSVEGKRSLFEEYKGEDLKILKNVNVDNDYYGKIIETIDKLEFNEKEADDQILKLYELNKDLL